MGLYVSSAAAVSPAEGLPSGYDTRQRRALSRWAQDELTAAIRTLHAESDGV